MLFCQSVQLTVQLAYNLRVATCSSRVAQLPAYPMGSCTLYACFTLPHTTGRHRQTASALMCPSIGLQQVFETHGIWLEASAEQCRRQGAAHWVALRAERPEFGNLSECSEHVLQRKTLHRQVDRRFRHQSHALVVRHFAHWEYAAPIGSHQCPSARGRFFRRGIPLSVATPSLHECLC